MEKTSRKWFGGGRTQVMGILNLSRDSFSGDGVGENVEAALQRAREMILAGADAIDIGAESTKPGFTPTDIEDDIRLLVPIVRLIKAEFLDMPLSVDTYKWQVAEACLEAGADIINDIRGLEDEQMIDVIARYGAGAIIMHSKPLQSSDRDEVHHYLRAQERRARAAGIFNCLIDPGLGFNKKKEESRRLLQDPGLHSEYFGQFSCAYVIGASRKGFLGGESGERKFRSIGAAVYAAVQGAGVVRVHDVKETVEALSVLY